MIEWRSAKHVHPFHAAKVPYFVYRLGKLKNEKRVCLKRIIKRQENQVVKRKVKMNPKLKTRKVASQNATTSFWAVSCSANTAANHT